MFSALLTGRDPGTLLPRPDTSHPRTGPADHPGTGPAERVQHDLHEARCACGRAHVAPRPAGVPDSALSIGPRLRALAV